MAQEDVFAQPEPEILAATFSIEGARLHFNEAWQRVLGGAGAWVRLAPEERERASAAVSEAAAGSLVTNTFFFVNHPDVDEPLPALLHFLPVFLPAEADQWHVQAVTVTGEVLREPGTWTQSQTQRNRLETLGRMTMGIAHDFNNLLSGILGHTELMKTATDQDAALRKDLRTIEQAAMDGAALIRKIQQYMRQEKQTHFEPVDLPQLVRDSVTLTRPYWYNEPRRRGIAIHLEERCDDVSPIMGSPTELREVLINLILNAVQAMADGGTLTLECRSKADGRVLVCVEDTGVGMDESVKEHIFEPLYTTKGERGTGMGLAVSYGIIQEHDGEIVVESSPGEGTRFEISFPSADARPTPVPDASDAPERAPARVLIVDDEVMVRNVLMRLLTLRGHDVTQASSGAEALNLVEDGRFDVVFTDHGMPEMSGRELARTLRRRHPSLPIVLLTGDTEVGEAGDDVDLIIPKPFQIDHIDATIQELM